MASSIVTVYDRVYVAPDRLPELLRAYVAFYGVRPTIRFAMPRMDMVVIGLESERVSFSVVSAPEEHLAQFRDTGQTILVTDIDQALAEVEAAGGKVVQPRTAVPPGFQGRGQLPGGPVIEFAQWSNAEPYRNPDLSAYGL